MQTFIKSVLAAPIRRLEACQPRYSSTLARRCTSLGYQWSDTLYLVAIYFRMAVLQDKALSGILAHY